MSEAHPSPEPLLIYRQTEQGWQWSGQLVDSPDKRAADDAAAALQGIWQEVSPRLSAKANLGVRCFTLLANGDLQVETSGISAPKRLRVESGTSVIVHAGATSARATPSKAPSRSAYRPVLERGGWANGATSPARNLYTGLSRVITAALSEKEDANRAARLGNVAFEIDGKDVLLVATDGHRLALHRLVDFARHVRRIRSGKALVPVSALRQILPRLKGAGEIGLDLPIGEGPKSVHSYGATGRYAGPNLVDAYQGTISIGSDAMTVPVVDQEFLSWRQVFPKPEWSVTVEPRIVLPAIEGLLSRWTAAMKSRPKRSAKKEPSARLVFSGDRLHMDITPDIPSGAETYETGVQTSGLNQNRPARFYMNLRYLRGVMQLMDSPVLISGENDGSKSIDGNSYLVKPVSLLDATGPTEFLVMPMHPPK